MSAAVAGGTPESRRHRGRGADGERAADRADEEIAGVKMEPDVDIKDYAETTVNELLGWYGYDKLDTRGLNLKILNHHFPTSSSSSSPMRQDEDMSEEDTGRSRSPHLDSELSSTNANGGTITCAWCLKTGLKLFTLKTSSGETKAFCSELCFNQCRRAAFKKNRVCNWCRHVRHTVNYVDFQDGDDQLQFCSDKCLNQYKMQIFCKETQAYLQMNPHLQEETSNNAGGSGSKLITPDLWLKDCQEPINGSGHSLSHSDDELTSPNSGTAFRKSSSGTELEDLSLASRSEHCNSVISISDRDISQEVRKNIEGSPFIKDKRSGEMCNTSIIPYFREDREKSTLERRKRHHDSEHARKRQRIASMRHRANHPPEAPPAHLSSTTHSPSPFQNQNRMFSSTPSPYPPQLNSPVPLNPPAAHSNPLPPHPAITGPLLPPGLPPPPPLLNNDFFHSSVNPSLFQSPFSNLSKQQQLDAILRLQPGIRHNVPFQSNLFQESILPLLRAPPPPPPQNSGSFVQPNTVMLPYPVFVPLPVPIPIPIPLSSFLPKEKQSATSDSEKVLSDNLISEDKSECTVVDIECEKQKSSVSAKIKNSKANSKEQTAKSEKQTQVADNSSYAVTNNDSQTNRLILTRNKTR